VVTGLLPRPEASGTWLGSADRYPQAHSDEVVTLLPLFVSGLGLPTCDFLRQLLSFYQIKLIHLKPNSILQLSVFTHLCEAFLGIPPSLDLFRHLFWAKP
jgi:hypothetical protein